MLSFVLLLGMHCPDITILTSWSLHEYDWCCPNTLGCGACHGAQLVYHVSHFYTKLSLPPLISSQLGMALQSYPLSWLGFCLI